MLCSDPLVWDSRRRPTGRCEYGWAPSFFLPSAGFLCGCSGFVLATNGSCSLPSNCIYTPDFYGRRYRRGQRTDYAVVPGG